MRIEEYQKEFLSVFAKIGELKIQRVVDAIVTAQQNRKTVYVFGNGGSGSNASHFVQDLLKCPIKDFSSAEGRFKAICLNDNVPVIMAYANDLSYEEIFKQQLMNFCEKGDLVIGVSGSGKSKNVFKAVEYANSIGVETFAIVGFTGGELLNTAKNVLHVPTENMQIYEDMTMCILHSIISSLKSV